MFKTMSVMLATATMALAACSSSGGVSEGDACGGPQDDCGNNLTCVAVQGRPHAYCCPTPTEASNYQNCHPAQASSDGTPR